MYVAGIFSDIKTCGQIPVGAQDQGLIFPADGSVSFTEHQDWLPPPVSFLQVSLQEAQGQILLLVAKVF